jgi:hypothetical protein
VFNSKADTVPSEISSLGRKRFGKKLYALGALIAIAVVAVALLVPQGAAIIPLSVEYTVGEKLVYHTAETIVYQTSNTTAGLPPYGPTGTTNLNATTIVEVIDFDNETYTLNHTATLDTGAKPISASFIEKVNKTGYSIYLAVEGNVLTPNATSSIITGLLERPEVKVGESWQIPLTSTSAHVTVTGSMTLTFAGIENITVLAGTYQVFRIDAASSNVVMTVKLPSNTNMSMSTIINSSGQIYIEYGTGRRIATTMESTVHNEAIGLNYTLSANTTLIQHIKP